MLVRHDEVCLGHAGKMSDFTLNLVTYCLCLVFQLFVFLGVIKGPFVRGFEDKMPINLPDHLHRRVPHGLGHERLGFPRHQHPAGERVPGGIWFSVTEPRLAQPDAGPAQDGEQVACGIERDDRQQALQFRRGEHTDGVCRGGRLFQPQGFVRLHRRYIKEGVLGDHSGPQGTGQYSVEHGHQLVDVFGAVVCSHIR